jgi:hypothetical protein
MYKKGWLQLHRITLLEQLGFKWTDYDATSHSIKNEALWQSKFYGNLLPFLYTHGHCNISTKYPADLVLHHWVKRQRFLFSKDMLRKDRMALLDGVHFVYRVDERLVSQLDEAKASTDLQSSTYS